ncbi:MAG: Ig-like domain-containing protein [Spirochaetales bacterium]|nr:Ig-like domain-containing protein [Spirochaetales bacterium]
MGEEAILSLTFSLPVEPRSAERIFRLTGPSGLLEGDFFWEGLVMSFTPLSSLQPGFRYTLSFQGRVSTLNGTCYDKDLLIPFYYLTDAGPPLLIQVSPAEATVVDVAQPVVLTFSRGMLTRSVEDSFSLQPGTKTDFQWNADNTVVTITPADRWVNLQYYTWVLTSEATNTEEIPIPGDYTGSFLVQVDTRPPALISSHPAHDKGDGSFAVLKLLTLNDLSRDDHIALVFSEAVDFESLTTCLKLEPSLEGYLLSLHPREALYYILEDIPPEQDYTLILRKGLEDSSGNPTTENIEVSFTPDIPALDILGISIDHAAGNYDILPESFNDPDPLVINGFQYYGTSPDSFFHISIHLSQGFSPGEPAARLAFADSVTLLPVFPPGTTAPDEYMTSWMSDTTVRFQFRDVITCTPAQPVYYRLQITGGDKETANHEGAYLLETVECSFQGALE